MSQSELLPKSNSSSKPSGKDGHGRTPISTKFHLGYSRVAKYQDCPKAYKFCYCDKIRGKGSVAMHRGNAYHGAVEFLLKYKMEHNGELISLARAERAAIRCAKGENLTETEIYKVIDAVRFYHGEMYPVHRPLFVEKDFSITRGGVEITGRIDLGHLDDEGKLWVIDHKFSYDKWAAPRAEHGVQPIIYQWAALDIFCKEYGVEYGGFAYNIIRLFPSPLVQVIEIKPLPQDQSDWFEEEMRITSEQIKTGLFPARPTDKGCGWCDYKKLCNPVKYKVKMDDRGPDDLSSFEDC